MKIVISGLRMTDTGGMLTNTVQRGSSTSIVIHRNATILYTDRFRVFSKVVIVLYRVICNRVYFVQFGFRLENRLVILDQNFHHDVVEF